jgi:uncharacterized protein
MMRVYWHEVTDEGREVDLSYPPKALEHPNPRVLKAKKADEHWLRDSILIVDEVSDFDTKKLHPASHQAARRTVTASGRLELRMVDEIVIISGKLKSDIELLCSRCGCEFLLPFTSNLSAMYCRDPIMAGHAYLKKDGSGPVDRVKGSARHEHNADYDVDDAKNLDITYVEQDYLELSEMVTEQIRLEVPFQPLCKEDCKGRCTNCGADLNLGRCACPKILASTPFSRLKDLKVNT